MEWLHEGFPTLPVSPRSVEFLRTPSEFYETLMKKIKSSRKRVIMAALYLGTGPLEKDMITAIEAAMKKNPNLRVGFLLDYMRGTRGAQESSVTMLEPISERGEAYFFHTPDLRGFVKSVLPERVNEVVGLQHMKFFIFDDDVIISGANLSDSYFTDRQDRYMVVRNNPQLANFFASLFDAVSSCSFRLQGGQLKLHESCSIHPFEGHTQEFRQLMSDKVTEVVEALRPHSVEPAAGTYVCPFLQMGAFGIEHESEILKRLFGHESEDISVSMATGYFNLHEAFEELITRNDSYPMQILFASPQANGFFGGSGLSGWIPALYVHVSYRFFLTVQRLQRNVKLYEYTRPNWTFHAKGIWIDGKLGSSTTKNVSATIIGSSNFGYRSVHRDLEAQLLLVSSDDALRRKMTEERNALMEYTTPVGAHTFLRRDHFVPLWVKVFTRVFRHFF
ncbi:phospholipase D family protein [Aphelenchoides avenae]|nr:phospholipase D family protein [Aphelenchus avenae]